MKPQSNTWLEAVAAWQDGLRCDDWTIVGTKGVPPPAAAVELGWRVEAMEGDMGIPDFSCLAQDDSGQLWFISDVDGWCTAVPLPPRQLTTEERTARARLDKPDGL